MTNYWEEINNILNLKLVNPWLRNLYALVLMDSPLTDRFKLWGASTNNHHRTDEGLVRHTWEMMKEAELICHYIYPHLDKELLLMAILLHDIGKVYEYQRTEEGRFERTFDGKMLGHISIGYEIVNELINKLPEFPKDLKTRLLHCILSHHGRKDWGSPVEPMFIEAEVLHQLDMISYRVDFHQLEKEKI